MTAPHAQDAGAAPHTGQARGPRDTAASAARDRDVRPSDTRPSDARPSDGGPLDARPSDGGPLDVIALDAGALDVIAPDADALDVIAYYRDPVKAPLLRAVMLPLAADAAAEGLAAHLERHWLHGPHVRLRLQGPSGRVRAFAASAASRIRDRLREHPSRDDLTDAQLLASAAESGRTELIAPPYGPLVPDNTVRVAPVDRGPVRELLGDSGTALREDLLRAGLPALRAGADFLGERGDAAPARLHLAVTALAAHAAAHPDGLAGAHYSYVSHLEDFLVHEDPDGRLRAAFDRQWDRAGDATTALVARLTEGTALGGERAWTAYCAEAWRLTRKRYEAGEDLHGVPAAYRDRAAATGDLAAATRWNPELRTRYSEFHRLLSSSDPHGTMWSRPDYLIHRATTNALYRLLALCDVRPLERYVAAHLVIRTVPDLTGCDWRTEVRAAADAARTDAVRTGAAVRTEALRAVVAEGAA
ncbi:lantibiotic dehydratase C-terminal domain-containing protein [Streptomyces sp. cmx-4-9]|uniref:lantibiotic dehydratase C-terminal domain-containing protein n=1 Tax=Streptomyces sp. cmx-4-9 TaxID=2790941 RepID=UPI003980817C